MMRTFAALLLLVSALPAQPSRDQRWTADLDFYFSTLQRLHPFLRAAKPAGWDDAITSLRARTASLSDAQILTEANRITATLGDAHTFIAYSTGNGFRFLPLRLRWLADGFYAVNAGGRALPALGKKIRTIQGIPADEVFMRARAAVPHENISWARQQAPMLMVSPDALHAIGILPTPETPVRVEVDNGPTLDLVLESAILAAFPRKARTTWPLNERSANLDYWFDFLPDSRTLYVKYNVCRDDAALPIATFASEIIETAAAEKPDRIVFDVRHNTGGSDLPFRTLMNTLGLALEAGRYPLPAKGAYAIIGRQTFSSGVSAAVALADNGVTLVGEPTGGKPSSPGNVQSYAMPESRALFQVSTAVFTRPGYETAESLLPDIAVEVTIEDLGAERDPFLAAIVVRN